MVLQIVLSQEEIISMSEIIKHGTHFLYKKEDWYGKEVKCPHCKCYFRITARTRFHQTTGGEHWATVTCPECGCTELKVKG